MLLLREWVWDYVYIHTRSHFTDSDICGVRLSLSSLFGHPCLRKIGKLYCRRVMGLKSVRRRLRVNRPFLLTIQSLFNSSDQPFYRREEAREKLIERVVLSN